MHLSYFLVVILYFAIAPNNFFAFGQDGAEVVILNTTLPINLTYPSAVYDGEDSIYILGGSISNVPYKQSDIVYRFSLTTEMIDIVGMLPEEVQTGDAFWDAEGRNIYYTYGASSYIYRVHIAFNGMVDQVETLSQLDNDNYLMFTTSCWDKSNRKAWIFGSPRYYNPGEDFFEFDANNGSITHLPGIHPNQMTGVKCVFDDETGHAYFIGGRIYEGSISTSKIFKFTPGANTLEELNVTLPYPTDNGDGVWDGAGNAYLFDTSFTTHKGLVKFTPQTNTVSYIEIPFFYEHFTVRMAVAYVPKLNRIYSFGGNDEDWWHHASKRIQYVQLFN